MRRLQALYDFFGRAISILRKAQKSFFRFSIKNSKNCHRQLGHLSLPRESVALSLYVVKTKLSQEFRVVKNQGSSSRDKRKEHPEKILRTRIQPDAFSHSQDDFLMEHAYSLSVVFYIDHLLLSIYI